MARLDWGVEGVWRARKRSVVKVSRDEGGGARDVDGVDIFGVRAIIAVAMLNLKRDLSELCFGGLVMKLEICGSECCCSEDV